MAKRREKSKFNVQSLPAHLRHINLNAAGDIGSERHMVAVPEGRDEVSVREFGAFTADLQTLATWLQHFSRGFTLHKPTIWFYTLLRKIRLFQVRETGLTPEFNKIWN